MIERNSPEAVLAKPPVQQKQQPVPEVPARLHLLPPKVGESDHSSNYLCPLCLNYLVKAVQTSCGHTYCEYCLSEYFLFFQKCLLCRTHIRNGKYSYSLMLDQLISDFIERFQPEETDDHHKRIVACRNWSDSKQYKAIYRSLKTIDVGQKLDVRDPNYIWCSATVIRLISKISEPQRYLRITYDGFDHSYDEDVHPMSPRVAIHGFFTSRTDIPRYLIRSTTKPNRKRRIVTSIGSKLVQLKKDCDLDSSSTSEDEQ